ncbi:hypothetical protein DFJ73DRAFT_755870 [Zopfochytrium polystomum]|nr:hypothetical protein DFJ73DRAFT_755870 [Zopfochytrium polystomum]
MIASGTGQPAPADYNHLRYQQQQQQHNFHHPTTLYRSSPNTPTQAPPTPPAPSPPSLFGGLPRLRTRRRASSASTTSFSDRIARTRTPSPPPPLPVVVAAPGSRPYASASLTSLRSQAAAQPTASHAAAAASHRAHTPDATTHHHHHQHVRPGSATSTETHSCGGGGGDRASTRRDSVDSVDSHHRRTLAAALAFLPTTPPLPPPHSAATRTHQPSVFPLPPHIGGNGGGPIDPTITGRLVRLSDELYDPPVPASFRACMVESDRRMRWATTAATEARLERGDSSPAATDRSTTATATTAAAAERRGVAAGPATRQTGKGGRVGYRGLVEFGVGAGCEAVLFAAARYKREVVVGRVVVLNVLSFGALFLQ